MDYHVSASTLLVCDKQNCGLAIPDPRIESPRSRENNQHRVFVRNNLPQTVPLASKLAIPQHARVEPLKQSGGPLVAEWQSGCLQVETSKTLKFGRTAVSSLYPAGLQAR